MTSNDINTIASKLESLHEKILKSKFAETVYESEVMALVLAVNTIKSQQKEIEDFAVKYSDMLIEKDKIFDIADKYMKKSEKSQKEAEAYKHYYSECLKDLKDAHRRTPCYLCDNARLNNELEDYNDFHSSGIGSFSKDCRIMLTSGSGKPLRIEIARWNDNVQQWEDIGIYCPKFCPECGREIKEYEDDSVIK